MYVVYAIKCSFIHSTTYSEFQVEISKSYTSTEWREDVKRILRKATETDNHAVFLFSDTQVNNKNVLSLNCFVQEWI